MMDTIYIWIIDIQNDCIMGIHNSTLKANRVSTIFTHNAIMDINNGIIYMYTYNVFCSCIGNIVEDLIV